MIVMKFGGTSVGSPEAFAQVSSLVRACPQQPPVVVVSAMSGVTDMLLTMARDAEQGRASIVRARLAELSQRHRAVARALISDERRQRLATLHIDRLLDNLSRILQGVGLVGEATARSLDAIAAHGEKLSSALLADILNAQGSVARAVSAEDLIVTDNTFGSAIPYIKQSYRKIQRSLSAVVARGVIPVVTGFIARSESGATTTLGRGGSDYTASLVGAALKADEVWIWTDVDGVMTADPRVVPTARSLPQLTYAEAAELSYYGAKVLHPKTVQPAMACGIPVIIKNTFNPDFPGTRIVASSNANAENHRIVRAVTAVSDACLITVQGAGMIGVPGIAARVFSAVAEAGANVLMISQSSSEYNICFAIPRGEQLRVVAALRRAFERELGVGDISAIDVYDDISVLAAVGEGMRGTPGVAGRLFSTLGRHGINVIAIAQGSSELNISFVVQAKDRINALRCIHQEFVE